MTKNTDPRLNIGQRVEDLYCYGGDELTAEERAKVIEFAASFEECSYTREELETLDHSDLVSAAYSAMYDYARGQL